MNIEYIGERLLPGQLGYFLTILAMVAAFFAFVSYWLAARQTDPKDNDSWKLMGRLGFIVHSLSVFGIVALLFFMLFNHYWEYQYIWQHSSEELPWYYVFSCFWEGQEGSTILWLFWHAVLGLVLMRTAGIWETRVLSVMGIVQASLATMLLGIYVFDYKVGASPFVLMREHSPELPVFLRANYTELIQNGNGLNPLLQNYWMVIHPPTLFLGFAATTVPFLFVVAALWKRDFSAWVKPALSWTIFACTILGTGILMGGAWAYEALSFGGFWAWDPVENASLVPWLVLIAGLHTLLAYRYTGHALKATCLFLVMSFVLIVYSTFLTKSGWLGDTSVHSFTDLGMSGQLGLFLLGFFFYGIFMLAYNWRFIPEKEKEESAYSREFWLFVGALLLVLFGLWISWDTSLPVVNKIFGTEWVVVDVVDHYNRYAIWFGILIALLTATIQYFGYKNSNIKAFGKRLLPSIIGTVVLTAAAVYLSGITYYPYVLFMAAAIFTVLANLWYAISVLSGKVRVMGASVAHIGFGFMLIGILISNANKEVISINRLGLVFGEDIPAQENIENVLLNKGMPIQMGPYWVTYEEDSISEPNTFYKVKYERKENKSDKASESFYLYPYAQINPKMGLISNPSTKHYLYKDIFTHVSMVANNEDADEAPQTFSEFTMAIGDTVNTTTSSLILKSINAEPQSFNYVPAEGDISAGAVMTVMRNGQSRNVEPVYYIRDNIENSADAVIDDLNITVSFKKINPKAGTINLEVTERELPMEYIIMKAIEFPFINMLWFGGLLTIIGFFMSLGRRIRDKVRPMKRLEKSNKQIAA